MTNSIYTGARKVSQQVVRSPLKWAGGKAKHIPKLKKEIVEGDGRLVDVFVGAGTLFLNFSFDEYLLSDINPDLIHFYQSVQVDVDSYVTDIKKLFVPSNNTEKTYYGLRDEFNSTDDITRKSALFLYLNRHGYNGLCRYSGDINQLKFNVPFGRYTAPYCPIEELYQLAEKSVNSTFICNDFRHTLSLVKAGDTVVSDPPYWPIGKAGFTKYSGHDFIDSDHVALTEQSERLQSNGVNSVIFNHDIAATRSLYANATYRRKIRVARPINRKGKGRGKVQEVIAFYSQSSAQSNDL